MAELADALDLRSSAERRGGSTPSGATNLMFFDLITEVYCLLFIVLTSASMVGYLLPTDKTQ